MAAYAWARSRSLFSRLWTETTVSSSDETVEQKTAKAASRKIAHTNKRFLIALKDGGIFLS